MTRSKQITVTAGVCTLITAIAIGAFVGYRSLRAYRIATDTKKQIKYLIEHGGTVGEVPADEALSADYLGTIFGDDPELLAQLKAVVSQGLSDSPALNLGEVAAMIVSYHRNEEGQVEDVVAHVVGGFPLGKRKPGMHRNGYFRGLVDPQLWRFGNSFINLLGRDMVLFADEQVVEKHQMVLESVFTGNIMPLVNSIEDPLFFTAVFPEPRNVLPGQLRTHIQAVVVKGMLSQYKGSFEIILLTPNDRSAKYTLSILGDMKIATEVALKTKWGGVEKQTDWGSVIDPWWAYELVKMVQDINLEKQSSVVRLKGEYERIIVNVVLKSIERMGRDLAHMRGVMDDKLDPRVVDAEMRTRKPTHYWTEEHRWGPNWPIPPKETNAVEKTKIAEATTP
jgi:hypothetical protein